MHIVTDCQYTDIMKRTKHGRKEASPPAWAAYWLAWMGFLQALQYTLKMIPNNQSNEVNVDFIVKADNACTYTYLHKLIDGTI